MINSLKKLITKKGPPIALIDNWRDQYFGYAIWEFEETLIWNYDGLYLSGVKQEKASLNQVQKIFNRWKNGSNEISAFGYINYNFKDILYPHIRFKKTDERFPLLFFAKPKKIFKYKIQGSKNTTLDFLHLNSDILDLNEYKKIIKKIKHELLNGNVYQINFTMPKKFKVDKDALSLYFYFRNIAKPKFGYYLNYNKYQILSFSPEQFFKVKNNIISSYPMKGTISRADNKIKDEKLKINLSNSIKDKAEHLMIVDLLRNDIGKIAKMGTVKVHDMYKIESHPTVHQMISCISGELKDNMKDIHIIEALFPGGSVTGAPKESAMKIIDQLETYSRNLYTGAIGYIKNNGDMNFNIPIRTLTINNGVATYPVGGGIVWDSNYKDEWAEAQLKSKILNM